MKLKKLETHDRLLSFQKQQSDIISQGCDECLKRNPYSLALQDHSTYIYIFAHPRTVGLDEKTQWILSGRFNTFEECPEKILIWQPRLKRPKPQSNSYLFRAKSNTDILEICWILPPEELWDQYEKGTMLNSEIVEWSINQYKNNYIELSQPEADDLADARINRILKKIADEALKPKLTI
jgi:hypothetical protein